MTLENLDSFYGSEQFYRHALNRRMLYTEGVKYVADSGAYWLIDDIAIANAYEPQLRVEEFQVWTLIKNGTAATLSAEDGNGNILYSKGIDYTDFPLDTIKFYVTASEDGSMIMLPSEY